MTGTPEQRVEALRQWLGYPIKQRDPEKNLFWYLRPGADDDAASETRPVAVGFYPELNEGSDPEIKAWVATKGSEVSQHFFGWFEDSNQPVMYLLLPEAQQAGRVALVLPSESRQWRQRQVLTYEWNSPALLTPLGRLQQGELELMQKVEDKPMFSVPLVEWAFYKPIATAKELAQELARVSREMEQIIAAYKESTLNEYLRNLFNSFKRELLPNLKVSSTNQKDYSFADIYAQTIAYGLFTARVFSHVRNPREDFNRQDAWDKLPETNPFLRQLFQGISEQPVEALGDDLADKISEVFSILRAAKMDAILSDFRQKMNREDIVIRFYEDFLAAYKPEMRERRGVYYTPEPVVSYMVRSVDILLKEKFEKPLGLADPEVMILDPACGTGTFLLWIFQLIHQRFEENPEALTEGLADKSWSGYVKERLLPRVFGFELLMAPYAIAHLKLGLFLEETGYQFDSGKRLCVYLADTLEELETKAENLFEEFISEESNQAATIKHDEKVMIVIGNPPYSYESINNGEWISGILQDYYQVDGKRIEERNPRGLQDDYVKFIRFGQWRIQKTQKGILAFVNNHSFISNPTFRGMRQSLSNAFSNIYLIDLNGNTKRKSDHLEKYKDENIFDIQQGVSVGFFVLENSKNYRQVETSELVGSREGGLLRHNDWEDNSGVGKYGWLSNNTISTTRFHMVQPSKPFYLFSRYDDSLLNEYNEYLKITEMFDTYSVGISTSRDKLTIDFSKEEILEKVKTFISLEAEEARKYFSLGKDVRDWKISSAQNDLRAHGEELPIAAICYRPFDVRYTCFTGNTCGFHSMPRPEVMEHLFERLGNIAICTNRQVNNEFRHAFVANGIADGNSVSLASRERTYVFPLYLSDSRLSKSRQLSLSSQSDINLSEKCIDLIRSRLGAVPFPENIFYYTYAILHCPVYRVRYLDFLKVDFPHIPFTSDFALFTVLSELGKKLVHTHLLESQRLTNLITRFEEDSDRTVDPGHPKYANGKVTINKRGAGFTGVPQEVWEFYIGGYQVCHKWLKDRKGRTLTDDDILHYQKIIVALQETIRIMQQIDDAIPSWPIE